MVVSKYLAQVSITRTRHGVHDLTYVEGSIVSMFLQEAGERSWTSEE